MRLSHTLTGLLAAALAIVALAATPALARPGGPASAAADAARVHEIYIPPAATPGPLWSYDYEAGVPNAAPAREPKAALTPGTGDGKTPWIAIGAGLGGACLLLAAGVATAGRIRPRVST
jgi:hypothetical protein